MIRRIFKITGWLVFTLAVIGLVALAGIAVWAATGPRDISEYTPYVQSSINEALPNNKIKVGKTVVSWGGFDELLVIAAENVQFYDHNQNMIAVFPQVSLRYGIRSLLTGYLIPSRVKLISPRIDLSWLKDETGGHAFDLNKLNFGKLRHIEIKNGWLVTPQSGEWFIDEANLWRGGQYLFVEANLRDQQGQGVIASIRTDETGQNNIISANLSHFRTQTLAPYISELAGINLIVNGTGSLNADSSKKLASFNVSALSGDVEYPDIFREKLEFKDGAAEGSYDFNSNTLAINSMTAEFKDGFKIGASGKVVDLKEVDLRAEVGSVTVANLPKYWPVPTSKDALAWVQGHLYGGQVTSGQLAISLSAAEAEGSVPMDKNSVNFKFNITGVNSKYSDKLLPLENVTGQGFIDADSLRLKVESAKLGKSAVKESDLAITSIGTPQESLSINVKMEGSAEDLADFYLNTGSGKKVIKNKTDLTGIAVSQASLKLPLLKDLKLDDVKYDIRAEIANASGKNVLDKVNVDKLKLAVAATNAAYEAKGECYATINDPKAKFTLQNAPISFEVASKGPNLKIAVGSDITNTPLTFTPLDVNKPVGEKGRLLVEIFDNGVAPSLNRVELSSSSLNFSAKGTLTKDYSNIASLDVANLQFGKTAVSGKMSTYPALAAQLKGDVFDAQPLIKYMKAKKEEAEEDNTEYKIQLEAGQILLLNGESLSNAYVNIQCAKDCSVISVNSKNVSINQTSTQLTAKTSDAGAFLNGIGIYDNMKGGELEIKADVSGSNYKGKAIITDFSIAKARILEKMLTLGSLTGIADTLRGKGIRFKKLSSDFEMDKMKLAIKEFRMVGPAIGITANGEINRKTDVADLSGNIIPAYTANTLLGKIPLIGEVIIGDDGVFALAYSMRGNVDDPSLSVNPLSVLAPGFLKNVFQ